MSWFGKPDVKVICYTTEELGNLLDWMRSQEGLSGIAHNRFGVTAMIGSALGETPKKLYHFEVYVPYGMYTILRDRFLKENSFTEVLLQEQVFNHIKNPIT